MLTPGQLLRGVREQLRLTMRDVEIASTRIAARHNNEEFMIALSRLSDIETKGVTPSIYRLYSLSAIYRRDMREMLSWYGIDLNAVPSDLQASEPSVTHQLQAVAPVTSVRIPVRFDASFDLRHTTNLGRVIEQWGAVPFAYLAKLAEENHYSYAYVGSEDFTMYPLIAPGSFLQVDESRTRVQTGMWRSEFERPIYFVETRQAFICAWCSLEHDRLILQPHPLSPESVRVFRHPQDAEILGQVVGVAMRLVGWDASEPPPDSTARPALN
jgi:transcriptional regulator with XRE-family HTH domain